MTHESVASVPDAIRNRIDGAVFTPDEAGYDSAREIFNAMHDRRPAAVVQPAHARDVSTAIGLARSAGLPIAVRGGGHSIPGFSGCDDGLVVDLRSLQTIEVDPARRIVRAGGGCTWGQLNDACHTHGLATPGGLISTTGIAGLTLGGGIGFLSREFGLACDNVVRAEVVTANGEIVECTEDENQDLFWAIRGGGGNFGVVTRFDFALHPVRTIVGGPTFFRPSGSVLQGFRNLMVEAPRQLGALFGLTRAPALPFLPEHWHGQPVAAFLTCWTGEAEELEGVLKPLDDWGENVGRHVAAMPYPVINTLFDDLLPFGLRHYWKSHVAHTIPDPALPVYLEYSATVPNVESGVFFHPVDGACHDLDTGDTAFPHRDSQYVVGVYGSWHDAAEDEANVRWVKDCHADLAPFCTGHEYVNFAAGDDAAAVSSSYGSNRTRLSRLKGRFDPDNVFRLNQNIPPA